MKYLNIKRYKFSTALKKINFKRYNFSRILKFINIIKLNSKKFYKIPSIKKFNLKNIPKINFQGLKYTWLYILGFFVFFGFIYLIIPMLYNYDKSIVEKVICKSKKIECIIEGNIKYSFYPTPRVKIYDLIINNFDKKKNFSAKIEKTYIKISLKNLLNTRRREFKKVIFDNFQINLDLKKHPNIFSQEINNIPFIFKNGQIILNNRGSYVALLNNVNFKLINKEDSTEFKLDGDFLNDKLFINLDRNILDNNEEEKFDLIVKMSKLNLLTKANFSKFNKSKKVISGNILIKKNKHKITSIFEYKDSKFIIKKSNIRNPFIDGSLNGEITFLPFFQFNLDADLNSINFTKLYSYFLSLDENGKKKIFEVNNKINGNLTLSSKKIYSSYNLVKSLETQLEFRNGDISVNRFLLNLGKLGATDILGEISKKKKFRNFKFESNIFVDNQKKFLSKFGIYKRKEISPSMFVSGNFDLDNLRFSIYEISDNEKLKIEDVNYIEKEFNKIMLDKGYESLFYFPNFKEFISIINGEIK